MKTILITGASRGIGREIAKLFAKKGYNVAINYNNSIDKAKSLYEEIVSLNANAILVKADVQNPKEVKHMVEETIACFGHIDILVNNAGICQNNLLIDESDELTAQIINVNLLGSIYTSKYVIPFMLKNGKGKIINISSIWGQHGASLESTYSSSKAGLIAFTKSLAKEYGYNNILVNCICPGLIDTDMNKNLSKSERDEIIKKIPVQRIGETSDISNLVLFLCEETGDYINGQVITVDGGFTL